MLVWSDGFTVDSEEKFSNKKELNLVVDPGLHERFCTYQVVAIAIARFLIINMTVARNSGD